MIELGQRVRDKITGFVGIATARIEYLNGCIQYCVKPKVNADGKMLDGEYIDAQQLEIITDENSDVVQEPTGGMMADTPSHTYR